MLIVNECWYRFWNHVWLQLQWLQSAGRMSCYISISITTGVCECYQCRARYNTNWRERDAHASERVRGIVLVCVSITTGVWQKKTLLQRRRGAERLAFKPPSQGLESSFCCRIAGQRLTWASFVFDRQLLLSAEQNSRTVQREPHV